MGILGIVEQKDNVLIIDLIEILPQYRNQRHGSNFLKEIEKEARCKGCKYLRTGRVLDPRSDNFWKKNGFRIFKCENNGVPIYRKTL